MAAGACISGGLGRGGKRWLVVAACGGGGDGVHTIFGNINRAAMREKTRFDWSGHRLTAVGPALPSSAKSL